MRATEVDTTEAQGKADRELLELIYGALITPEPTALNPHPPPGLIERVDRHIADDTAAFAAITASLDELKAPEASEA